MDVLSQWEGSLENLLQDKGSVTVNDMPDEWCASKRIFCGIASV